MEIFISEKKEANRQYYQTRNIRALYGKIDTEITKETEDNVNEYVYADKRNFTHERF